MTEAFEPGWLMDLFETNEINLAMDEMFCINNPEFKLKGKQITILRQRMKRHFKKVTGRDL